MGGEKKPSVKNRKVRIKPKAEDQIVLSPNDFKACQLEEIKAKKSFLQDLSKLDTRVYIFPWKPHPNQAGRISPSGFLYSNPDNKIQQGLLVDYFRLHYKDAPPSHEGPVSVKMSFLYPKPKSWYPGKLKTRPDLDNLEYTPNNAFKGVIWEDDDTYFNSDGLFKGYWDRDHPATILEVTYYEPTYPS